MYEQTTKALMEMISADSATADRTEDEARSHERKAEALRSYAKGVRERIADAERALSTLTRARDANNSR